jgi:hypothetical protein
MNLESAVLLVLGGAGCLWGARLVYGWLSEFSDRTANDVLAFLVEVDMAALNGTFHPEAEAELRQSLPPAEFRTVQWKRFHLAIHYCNKLSHNARVFQGWTRYERKQSWHGMTYGLQKTVQELRITCTQCRLASFVIRTRLRFWLARSQLLPFLPLPSFETLIESGSADMISFYENVKHLAELFSLAYGEEYHDKLMRAL